MFEIVNLLCQFIILVCFLKICIFQNIFTFYSDGDPDIASASSGDNTIAVFKNIDRGIFCEIKEVVDDNAIGARTVIAADLNDDGWLDLASASKDDNSVSWYPNDGTGHFPSKIVISAGEESEGAYSLFAVDIDKDGDQDLIVASNANDHVSIWRNDGSGNFNKTLVFDDADFVLSVVSYTVWYACCLCYGDFLTSMYPSFFAAG